MNLALRRYTCIGQTAAGKRCKRKVSQLNGLCYQHKIMTDAEKAAKKAKRAAAFAKKYDYAATLKRLRSKRKTKKRTKKRKKKPKPLAIAL